MSEIASLQSAGLSKKEAQTYLDLQLHGESQTGKICGRTKIPSSYIYTILNSLSEKGLITFKIVNNVKVFSSTNPENLAHLFQEKEQKIKVEKEDLLQFISKLKVLPPTVPHLNDFKYFYGLRGIKSLYTEISNSWKPGQEYCVASAPLESFRKLEGFFLELHQKRIHNKVKLRMIVNNNSQKWGQTREKMAHTEVRYLDVNSKTEYGVIENYFFLVTYAEEPYGMLIKDESFAATFKSFFEILWRTATKKS